MSTNAPDPTYTTPGWTSQANGNENVTAGAGTAAAAADPNGFQVRAFSPDIMAIAGVTATAGTAWGTKLVANGAFNTSKAGLYINTIATTPTHGWVYLLDASGNLKASTADMTSSAFTSGTGYQTFNWQTPFAGAAGTYYVVALMVGGTALKLGGLASPGAGANINTLAANGNLRFATFGTGLSATLTTPFTMTNMVADSTMQLWAALA